jgi:TolA-binding protein
MGDVKKEDMQSHNPIQHKQKIQLPKSLEAYIESIAESLCEEIEIHPNELVSLQQKKENIRIQVRELFEKQYLQLQHAEHLLQEAFQVDDEKHPQQHTEDAYNLWKEAQEKLKEQIHDPKRYISLDAEKPLQEVLGISWAFMDRSYQYAVALLKEKRFSDAEAVFRFLQYLHPAVFEYWLGLATCQQEENKFDEAISTYNFTLFFKQLQPLIFYQMAQCSAQMHDEVHALEALDQCLASAEKDDVALLEDARALQAALQRRNS